jgi:hypothetical protein
VLIEGVFDSGHIGHLGGYSGSVRAIRRFERWRPTLESPRPPPRPKSHSDRRGDLRPNKGLHLTAPCGRPCRLRK